MEILKTKNYDLFKRHLQQRELQQYNVKRIMASMQEAGFLETRPILVDGDFNIYDGGHRLEAAQRLGIEVFYTIDKSLKPMDIIHLNEQKPWMNDDYLNFWAAGGNQEYMKLKDFLTRNNVSLGVWLKIFDSRNRKAVASEFRRGGYVFDHEKAHEMRKHLDNATLVMEMIHRLKPGFVTVMRNTYFRVALVVFLMNPQIEIENLLKKVELRLALVRPCSGVDEYCRMWLDIYNFRLVNKVSFDEEG